MFNNMQAVNKCNLMYPYNLIWKELIFQIIHHNKIWMSTQMYQIELKQWWILWMLNKDKVQ